MKAEIENVASCAPVSKPGSKLRSSRGPSAVGYLLAPSTPLASSAEPPIVGRADLGARP